MKREKQEEPLSINTCTNLAKLYDFFKNQNKSKLAELTESGEIDLNNLPNFGGERPKDISCLSWDKKRVLVEYQTCDYEIRFAIINR